ncbi:hypothetical protein HOF78_00350 [Candidatus Woesearchaeota archaeon]|jgi:hypothetical protein|nr:hypothetical protein [Candidatus Woesearchaeota archaeon]MBT6044583.1 hypothetical protein [Candidatus Woesearchaeota archaeon]
MFDLGLNATSYLPFLLIPTVFVIAILWELIWKGLALWKAAKSGQKYWFIAILVVNSLGLLPIIYLVFFQGKKLTKKTKKRKK